MPADNIELIQLLEFALNTQGPYYIRLPRGSFPKIHNNNYKFSLGRLDIIKEGNDICLIGTGYGSILATQSASIVENHFKNSVKVINLPSIKPIDQNQLINEIKNIKGIIVIEEHNIYCGLGCILARMISDKLPIPMKFIGIDESFGKSGSRESLLDNYGLNLENLIKQIEKLFI